MEHRPHDEFGGSREIPLSASRVGGPSTVPWTIGAGALGVLLLGLSLRLAFECGAGEQTAAAVLLVGASLLLGSAIGVRVAQSILGRLAATLVIGVLIAPGLGVLWFFLSFDHCFVF